MNILVLKPEISSLEIRYFKHEEQCPALTKKVTMARDTDSILSGLSKTNEQILHTCGESAGIELIAVHATYGGTEFKSPEILSQNTLKKLEKLLIHAPLHTSILLELLKCIQKVFPQVPSVLLFETAFFNKLPPREYTYAIDEENGSTGLLRRFGFHGILHEAAYQDTLTRRMQYQHTNNLRVLSLCLEPQPELTAVYNGHPLTITSGSTPLEGLPGHTTCGELDPGIIVDLVQEKGLGPEQINELLCRQSGLKGLTGEHITFNNLFAAADGRHRFAYKHFFHRVLLACGAGIAAMGGADYLVLSGRYAEPGRNLGLRLQARLTHSLNTHEPIALSTFSTPVEYVIRTLARRFYISQKQSRNCRELLAT